MEEPEAKETWRRIHVVGDSAAGKSTLARALAARFGASYVELDSLHWGPHWTAAEPDEFRRKTEAALVGERWVVDGNYRPARALVWGRVQVVVWLDYSLTTVLWRLTRRTWTRVLGRDVLWNGNRETLRRVFSRDSLYLWVLRTHRRRRKEYEALIRQPEHASIRFVRLRSPHEAEVWFATLPDRGQE